MGVFVLLSRMRQGIPLIQEHNSNQGDLGVMSDIEVGLPDAAEAAAMGGPSKMWRNWFMSAEKQILSPDQLFSSTYIMPKIPRDRPPGFSPGALAARAASILSFCEQRRRNDTLKIKYDRAGYSR